MYSTDQNKSITRAVASPAQHWEGIDTAQNGKAPGLAHKPTNIKN